MKERTKHRGVTIGCMVAAIGGFCRAFQQAGAKGVWANDKDRFAGETFRLNFPGVNYIANYSKYLYA